MSVVKATFDGRVFVPCEPVGLPPGTTVGVVIPDPPPQPTAEQQRVWREIQEQLDASAPRFPTVEEAVRYTRKRP